MPTTSYSYVCDVYCGCSTLSVLHLAYNENGYFVKSIVKQGSTKSHDSATSNQNLKTKHVGPDFSYRRDILKSRLK